MSAAVHPALLQLAAALGTRDAAHVDAALVRCAATAAKSAVDEVLLQSHLFIGFPDVLRALQRWRELGTVTPAAAAATDRCHWPERGERVCAAVYGSNYHKLRRNVVALHPDLDEWMVTGGYGRVLGRPGLDLAARELCIVALLAVWDAEPQLHSHLRGALNAGATVPQVEEAVATACCLLPEERAARVRQLWTRVRERGKAPRSA